MDQGVFVPSKENESSISCFCCPFQNVKDFSRRYTNFSRRNTNFNLSFKVKNPVENDENTICFHLVAAAHTTAKAVNEIFVDGFSIKNVLEDE